MKPKPIVPQRERCPCGKKVLNHHWLCDSCWGEKCKLEMQIKKLKHLPKDYVGGRVRKLQKELKERFSEDR